MKHKAIFLDRDGVLNIDKAYLYEIDNLEWVAGAKEAVAEMVKQGYLVFVVTNQSGIARGYYNIADMEKLHQHMLEEIKSAGGNIDKFYYCPHLKEGAVEEYAIDCDCRKPNPGMLLQVCKEYEIDKEESFLIGDNVRDIEAAEAAGIKGYLFEGGNLLEFLQRIFAGSGA